MFVRNDCKVSLMCIHEQLAGHYYPSKLLHLRPYFADKRPPVVDIQILPFKVPQIVPSEVSFHLCANILLVPAVV